MNPNVVYCILAASVILGTVGGILEHFAAQGGSAYKVGVFLASAGTDLAGLVKLLAGGAASGAVKSVGLVVGFVGFSLLSSGCLSSAPVVPVTPDNQAQVASCQSTAALHNGIVIGDFALGGATSGLASAAAAIGDQQTKTDLAITGAVVGGALVVGTALAELTASNFANSKCTSVVGDLPAAAAPEHGK